MPTLHMICVKAPKKPLFAGGAISEMYRGTITTAAPAPTPDTSLPNAITAMLGDSASKTGPMVKHRVVICIARRRPYLPARGAADSAPTRPPSVYMEPTTPHWVGVISMHCGRLGLAVAARSVEVMDFFLQRMTSSGALSSDWLC